MAGDTYKKHQSAIEREKALREEYEVIRNTPKDKLSYAQEERYEELKSQLENPESTKLKEQLDSEMRGITEKDDYLLESYYERARGEDAFTADLSKYDEKQRKIIKNAIDSGILNNKRSTHKVIDWIAKIAGEKGIDVDFANNERLKESGLAISDGQIINGFAQDGKVTYNLESAKVTEAVIGHEITHVFEGTDLYNELSDMITKYATANGTYESTIKALKKTYRTMYDETSADFDSKIQKEFIADFIGDTLFTDENFIAKLSEKPTLFSKVYDEIKYLAKSAKGTEAEKQLLDLQRKFEKMYREADANKESGTKYSLEKTYDGIEYIKVEKDLFVKEDGSIASEREIFDSLVGKPFSFPEGEVTIVKRLPGKNMYNELSRRRPARHKGVSDVKQLNSDVNRNAKELLANSKIKTLNEPDVNNKHQKQGISSFDTRKVKFYDGTKAYNIEFSIATLQNGMKVAYAKKFFGYDDVLTKKYR